MLKLTTKITKEQSLPLLNQSIGSVHRLLLSGQLSPVELLEATLERIRQTAALNAFITVPEEVARRQARHSAERFAKGQPLGLLDGIPLSFKDNFSTKDVPTTCASKMLAKYVPPFNATVVERLTEEGGGAVMVGKTNMDEFAMGAACSESFFGRTYNPWRSGLKFRLLSETSSSPPLPVGDAQQPEEWFIPGGSSGGSAVAVATGASFAALSSDTGGSTRNPASRVGIVGFKPSYGLISRFGLIPLTHSLDVPGVMGRTVEDVTAVFAQLHGLDHRDSTTVEVDLKPQNSKELELSGLRIGIPEEYRPSYLDASIAAAWDETIELLSKAGARISSVSLPHTKYSLPCYSILNTAEVASNFACYDGVQYGHRSDRAGTLTFEDEYTATREEAFNDIVKGRIIAGNYFLLSEHYQRYYEKALTLRRLITDDFAAVFAGESGVQCLLTPVTVTGTMSYRDWSLLDSTEEAIKEDYCTQPTNMAGLPAISLPVKVHPISHLPIGLQLIGPRFADYSLLRVAGKLERLLAFPRLIFDQ